MSELEEDWFLPLKKAMARWEVVMPPDGEENFRMYLRELALWNERINLTALREPKHIALGHFADSLAPMVIDQVFEIKHAHAIDIGTGAGFPGLPLKVINPDWRMALVESIGKKCDFLRAVVGSLELNRVEVHQKRSEELAHDKAHREKYDFAFARALSSLSTLIEYGLPFLKMGGLLIAHRGRTAADEASRVNVALEQLGGEISEVRHYEIPELGGSRSLVVIKKVRPTSKHYPRRTGVASKRPL
ncbi:MAG: Ribosomal RNA small subunit methyltransferase G [Elusimicrobia bacterium]|nr:Ribosomal RNA small subunit methyltransferase G [Elusimicrobiota bacterium]